ncbi:MAG TPA: hypothetical protein VIV63_02190 [Steroidobacteraceae bacterium]
MLLVIAAISAAVSVLLAGRMPPAMASFRDTFASLGVVPPPSAVLVFRYSQVWWVLAVGAVAVFVWIAMRASAEATELKRMKLALCLWILLTALVYGFTAYAIYTPLSGLGAAI